MFSNDENDENEVRVIYSSCMTFKRIRVHYLWAIIDVSAL